jgi:hypothetical protein
MTPANGDTPNVQKTSSDIKARKLSCFKLKNMGHMARNWSEPPPGPCHECSKIGGYQWHWRMDCPHSQRGTQPDKTPGVSAEAIHD